MTDRIMVGAALTAILFRASYTDIKRREVDDHIHVMILLLSLVGFSISRLPSMIAGLLAVAVPMIAVSCVYRKNLIGGADIKLTSVCGFLLGPTKGLIGLTLGLMLAVIVMPIINKVNKRSMNAGFPLVPFLSVGILTAYLI